MAQSAQNPKYRRIVVKVGTSTLTRGTGRISQQAVDGLIAQIAQLREQGTQVLLVTSGAITAGLERLGLESARPSDMPSLQAAAAIGQIELARRYEHSASFYRMLIGQVLLTRNDTGERQAYLHARDTLERLLEMGALPVINENDTVSVDEIRFGDNDTLAATIATLVGADLVILLSDIKGLYTADPRKDEDARFLERVEAFTQDIVDAAGGAGSVTGSGGMATKVNAARVLMRAGIPMVICEGDRPNVILDIAAGRSIGTLFSQQEGADAANAKKLWIALGNKAKGNLVVDKGAVDALTSKGSSLLPVGVRAVEGGFKSGDVVNVVDEQGRLVARGLTRFSSAEAQAAAGCKSSQLQHDAALAHLAGKDIIHRDEMIVF